MTEASHLAGLRSKCAQLAALQQGIEELRQRAGRVLKLSRSRDDSSQPPGIRASEHVRGQCAVLVSLLQRLAHDDLRPSEVESLVHLANTKCDTISAMLQRPSSSVPSLITLPESCFSGHIGPLVGTKTIITKLAPSHPSLHTISRKPVTHKTLHLGNRFSFAITVTPQQVAVWGSAFSRAKRAVLACAPSLGVVELLEHARDSLEELEAWSDCYHVDKAVGEWLREGRTGEEVIFPLLARVKVAGWWICVANRRHWTPISLVDIQLRDTFVVDDLPQLDLDYDHPEKCSGHKGDACSGWLAGPGPHHLTLEVPEGWGGAWHIEDLRHMLKPSIKRLRRIRCAPIRRWNLDKVIDFAMQLEELHIDLDDREHSIDTEFLQIVAHLRSTWMAPHGIITFTCCLGVTFDILRELQHLENCPSWADTLIHLASLVKRVVFPHGLGQGEAVPSVVLYRLPQLVFLQAEKLQLCHSAAGSEPLPGAVLSHISDTYLPRVTTLDLGEAVGMREEAVSKALDLKSIREVHFERKARISVPFFFPRCLGACSQTGSPLHIKTDYRESAGVRVDTSVWALWEGGGGSEGQKGVQRRVQKISVTVRWERSIRDDKKGGSSEPAKEKAYDQEGDRGILKVCLHAIDRCPLLDSIVVTFDRWSFSCSSGDELEASRVEASPIDMVGVSCEAVRSQLLSRGFVAVQTGPSCVRLCRVFGRVFPRWLVENVSALSPYAVFAPPTSMEDTVSLPESGFSSSAVFSRPQQ
ncbi:unnamed protein product [Vitrella brassicaformis CCMP3155]|uniref:Uncharacterized protein n=2 Tax=Vitrella brassicaformis TaxID=1169539 RepID=A0A0G4GS52_VITBC|nr:unnamed protein product [Vitrella brassicaformis CCMP3155]|eukprot:CEM33428.1 unnamed protein product [Vitrella brassicaformis CCMP3155]